MKNPARILFLGFVLLFVIGVATMVIVSSNRLQELRPPVHLPLSEGFLSTSDLKQYINPQNTTDPIVVQTVGSIVFDSGFANSEKISAIKAANYNNSFIDKTVNSTNYTDMTKVSIIQNYLLSLASS